MIIAGKLYYDFLNCIKISTQTPKPSPTQNPKPTQTPITTQELSNNLSNTNKYKMFLSILYIIVKSEYNNINKFIDYYINYNNNPSVGDSFIFYQIFEFFGLNIMEYLDIYYAIIKNNPNINNIPTLNTHVERIQNFIYHYTSVYTSIYDIDNHYRPNVKIFYKPITSYKYSFANIQPTKYNSFDFIPENGVMINRAIEKDLYIPLIDINYIVYKLTNTEGQIEYISLPNHLGLQKTQNIPDIYNSLNDIKISDNINEQTIFQNLNDILSKYNYNTIINENLLTSFLDINISELFVSYKPPKSANFEYVSFDNYCKLICMHNKLYFYIPMQTPSDLLSIYTKNSTYKLLDFLNTPISNLKNDNIILYHILKVIKTNINIIKDIQKFIEEKNKNTLSQKHLIFLTKLKSVLNKGDPTLMLDTNNNVYTIDDLQKIIGMIQIKNEGNIEYNFKYLVYYNEFIKSINKGINFHFDKILNFIVIPIQKLDDNMLENFNNQIEYIKTQMVT